MIFAALDRYLMAAPIGYEGGRRQPGPPARLFDARAPLITAWGRDFAVSGDGQRFLIVTSAAGELASPITIAVRSPLP